MDLKFYLNKIIKIDNIEGYTLKSLINIRECYENFLDKTEGLDPDFPTLNFGGKGKKLKNVKVGNFKDPTENDYNDNIL